MITYGTDIAYGICATFFLGGIIFTLLIETVILAIVARVLERKTEKMLEEEGKDNA